MLWRSPVGSSVGGFLRPPPKICRSGSEQIANIGSGSYLRRSEADGMSSPGRDLMGYALIRLGVTFNDVALRLIRYINVTIR
jgi:hypothetical protein